MPNGKKIGDQGTAPKKVFYLEAQNAKTFSATPTQWITLIPTVYNADTLGIRPDLVKRPIESWKELLNPEFKGKTSILNIPRSASWMPRWWSRRWASTNTATRAT